jgi:hypothetical protein
MGRDLFLSQTVSTLPRLSRGVQTDQKGYECLRCFAKCSSQAKYSSHLKSHFPAATAEERVKIDHIISSKMFKKMPAHDRRNPVFAGYIKPKSTRKIGGYPAADQIASWLVILGELG